MTVNKPTLYLMLGYPGAGKTTTAEVVQKLTGAIHLSSDRIRLELFPEPKFTEAEHQQLYKEIDRRTEELLQQGKDVIYDANLNRYIHRKEKYDICKRTGAQPVILWLRTAEELAKERATVLGEKDPVRRPFGNLAVNVFARLVRQIEPPLPSEHVIEIDGTRVTKDYVAGLLNDA